jgi:hypothetical protein
MEGDTALAERERAGGADSNLFRIFVLMWGAIRMIDPWLSPIPASRVAPYRSNDRSIRRRKSRHAHLQMGVLPPRHD